MGQDVYTTVGHVLHVCPSKLQVLHRGLRRVCWLEPASAWPCSSDNNVFTAFAIRRASNPSLSTLP
jgi:hypothetical protein